MQPSVTRTHARSGLTFTAIGYGGAPIGNFNGTFTELEALAMVDQSWDQGIRYFDTAPGYGNGLSEHRLGQALRQHNRSEYVLSSKVGRVLTPMIGAPAGNGDYLDIPPFVATYDYSYDGVMRAVEQSMQRMLTDRFDALFIHDCDVYTHGDAQPEYFRQAIVSGFPALEMLRDQGVVQAIGFGVNETDVMLDAVKAVDVDICLLAGRYTLLEQQPLDDLLPLCEDRGVGIVLGGVYNSGVLATGAVDGARFNYGPAPADILDKTRALESVCNEFEVPLPAVALQFAYAHPVVTSVCLGARNPGQQARNADLFGTEIPVDLWDELRSRRLIREDAPTPSARSAERD
ncbi:aldo/keto reductase [Mycolicibacterium smegmatis]|uniref:aldo/keto reductase n=1 Tax=Mycolicibacterium smegmatis TaxID=1772 RepID=UPI0005D930B8|nr:aldo/keto reductase [Mycolicibacterium smegmatis]MDF1903223.1 aldo/keto reductase [Mycolicibacterium smegmatis]MDF1909826.1 aldo/keto reductase [Mycolicibacterium smegmatis]MDF1921738.1 aldo/keto reductase [Mycolicibacterium smegmatis]MDF1928134.1 aldo/keto reductase [Mycolicibacterium smegmatis]UGT75335.1 aldo/keto reductase [Mycolicibacterium smegmatis]